MKAIALTVLGMICFLASTTGQASTKWRGPTGDGIYQETGLLKEWPDTGPPMLWHFDALGEGYSSPVFANGRIYINGMLKHTGYVFVLSETGELIDKFEYGEEYYVSYPGSRSSVTVAGGLLYVMSGKGELVCMDAENGEIKWSRKIFRDFDGKILQWGINETPMIDGNTIYCTPGGSRYNVVALDRFSGKLIWASRGKGKLSAYCTPMLVELSSRKIIITHTEKNIICIDASNGEVLWSHYHPNTWGIHANTPLFHDGTVYCFSGGGTGGVMIEMDQNGNKKNVKWTDKTLDSKMGGAVLVDGFIYGSGENNRSWKSLNWDTGEQGYSSSGVGHGVVISADGNLYLYSQKGELALVPVNPNEFKITGKTRVTLGSGPHWAHPVINEGRLFVRHGNVLMAYAITGQSRTQSDYSEQWPGFRGPYASGIMENVSTPVNWDAGTGENIKWKTEIPGLGHSCPIIWDDFVFVTTAVSGSGKDSLKIGLYGDIDMVNDTSEHEFRVYCLDKNTGKIIWERLSHKGVPKTRRHTKSSHANPTPVTDGKHLLVMFGSEGLFCYDFEGRLLWKKDFGIINAGPYTEPGVEWGFGSSPVIHNGKFIVQCDVTGEDFLGLYEVTTGNEIWKVPRDEVSTWCSPAVYEKNGKTQIIVNGYRHMGGYDFETGEEIWRMSGGGDAPVPTPVIAHDLIFINNAHGRYSPVYAVKPSAKGDITLDKNSTTNEYIVWSIKRGGAYMQTSLIYGDFLYNLRGNGTLTCFEAKTGKEMYKQNLGVSGGVTASGVASEDKLYFTSEKGNVFVVAAGPVYRLLSKNSMGDLCMATPAISDGVLFFRTQNYLIAVSDQVMVSRSENQ